MRRGVLALALALAGCGDEPARPSLPYDLRCPGSPGCKTASGPLWVGVARRDISPTVTETLLDCGLDQLCPGDLGYVSPDPGEDNGELDGHPLVPDPAPGLGERWTDSNGNGVFDAVWIAGFGNARPALGVHDPIWARALVLRQGETALALVAVDLVGYFYDEVVRLRQALDPALGIDLLLVAATHSHEGPDTVGIWGYDEGSSGVDPVYMGWLRAQILDAVAEAAATAVPATAIMASGDAGVHPDPAVTASKGINNIVADGRDPVVIDPELRVVRFVRADDQTTIGTLVNWQSHPEALCGRNRYISSDFPHWLRLAVEEGVHRGGVEVAGVGGTAIYVNGAVGGLLGPLDAEVVDLDGEVKGPRCATTNELGDPFFDRARAFGELVGLDALRLLTDGGEQVSALPLSFATRRFRLPIENWAYHAMFITGVFYNRTLYDWDSTAQITDENLPRLETEVAAVSVGPLQALTVPGELFPEWFIGGYDGAYTGPEQTLINEWYNLPPDAPRSCAVATDCDGAPLAGDRTCAPGRCRCTGGLCLSDEYNPPDLAAAPSPPYLRDRMSARHRMLWGLCPDELGYIVVPYDFQLDPVSPYVEQAPGSHYEETNSIGVQIGPEVVKHLTTLLGVLSP